MAIKKSELYSSIWSSCDALRGGMDASQYKDYVLVLLFIKYVSDKYAGQPFAPLTIPPGASFKDMVALKGKSDIGDQINKKIIGPLATENKLSDMPDFNDATKLGTGKEMVERLTDLIAIFENKALDFSKNRADGDDILGDAYEYLMRHFATESGKSKGQFYTPAEVSRIMAQVVGIKSAKTSANTTVYDPTCGSGSLLIKVRDEASTDVTLYGQEKDAATSALARMNMILHNNPTALVMQGNTLADPKFKDGEVLKTFDYVVANPPFSDKRWSTGLNPANDPHERFKSFGVPPERQGDYAYLLHIVRSLKSNGKGACILPHGVLFRGGAEADIRKALVRKGYVRGIIGLPANLFYGTSIPACIVVIDKQEATTRKGVFMIDASAGFLKDGPKNRLRAMDIHKIVDVFARQIEVPRYSRMVSMADIEKNDFNLNLPRYIESQTPEDAQDIEGHLRGGIPAADVEALSRYWDVCPALESALLKKIRKGYLALRVDKAQIKTTIYEHPEFAEFIAQMNAHFAAWRKKTTAKLKALTPGFHPKELISTLSESLLAHYDGKPLLDRYDIYQHVMDYWASTMQDDAYLIDVDGWKAETYRIIEKDKKGKDKDKGWACDLVPKSLIVARYYAKEQAGVDQLSAAVESVTARLAELEEEHGGEEGAFSELDKVNKANVTARLKEIKSDKHAKEEAAALNVWLGLNTEETDLKKRHKDAEAALDAKALAHYVKLTETDVKVLVVDDKWLAVLDAAIHGEMDRLSQQLTTRVKELAERYETPLPQATSCVAELEAKVSRHLETLLAKKRHIKQGATHELLAGKTCLPGFEATFGYKQTEVGLIPKDWDVSTVGAEFSVQLGKMLDAEKNVGLPKPFLGNRAVQWGRIDLADIGEIKLTPSDLQRFRLRDGDLLVCEGGEVGRAAVWRQPIEECYYQKALHRLRPIRGYNVQLMLNMLQRLASTGLLLNFVTQTSIAHLPKDKFETVPLPLPPTLLEQAAIAAVLSDIDAELTALETKLAKARHIKQGMMQELLTGRTRLV